MPRIRLVTIALAAAAVAFVPAMQTVAPATAAPQTQMQQAAQQQQTQQILEAQERHFTLLDRIHEIDDALPESRIGQIVGDPAANTMTIGWVGEVPAAVTAVVADAAAQGIQITIAPAAASEDAIIETALGVATSMPQDASIMIDVEADAMTIGIPTATTAARTGEPTLTMDAAANDMIADAIDAGEQLGIDVSVASSTGSPVTTSRIGDTQDLRGGSKYYTQFPTGAWVNCTSGFQAVMGHQQAFITAAHCSDYADGRGVRSTSTGAQIGVTDYVHELNDTGTAFDLAVVRLNMSIFNRAEIYTDPMPTTMPVQGWHESGIPAGYWFCSSGSVTFAKCNLFSGGTAVACYSTAHGTECQRTIRVTGQSGSNSFCFGDSGGPVYTLTGAGGVMAAGVVSGIVLNGAGASCGNIGYVAPIADLFSTVYGIQLRSMTIQP